MISLETWLGASAICLNNRNEVLMVKNADVDGWSVPSGEIERGETAAQCCVREVKEETGYTVKTIKQLYVKETLLKSIRVTAYYFTHRDIHRDNQHSLTGFMYLDETMTFSKTIRRSS